MNALKEIQEHQTRRAFLERSTLGLGSLALGSLLNAATEKRRNTVSGLVGLPHFTPKSEASNLSLSVRGPFSNGSLRL